MENTLTCGGIMLSTADIAAHSAMINFLQSEKNKGNKQAGFVVCMVPLDEFRGYSGQDVFDVIERQPSNNYGLNGTAVIQKHKELHHVVVFSQAASLDYVVKATRDCFGEVAIEFFGWADNMMSQSKKVTADRWEIIKPIGKISDYGTVGYKGITGRHVKASNNQIITNAAMVLSTNNWGNEHNVSFRVPGVLTINKGINELIQKSIREA